MVQITMVDKIVSKDQKIENNRFKDVMDVLSLS